MIIDLIDRTKKWWKEEDLVFDGVSSTRYWWPKDRPLIFGPAGAKPGDGVQFISFCLKDFDPPENTLDFQIQAAMQSANLKARGGHLTVVKIVDKEEVFGIATSDKKIYPVMDFHSYRKRKLAKENK